MEKHGKITVGELAKLAGIGADDATIALWDAGFKNISTPSNVVSGSELKSAYRALEMPTAMELRSSVYWKKRLNLDDDQFRELLHNLGFTMEPAARRVPQGSTKKLLQLAKKKMHHL